MTLISEHPDAVWIATIKSLTPAVVEELFLAELGRLSQIESLLNNPKPHETLDSRYLFVDALRFASIAAANCPDYHNKLSFITIMRTWELLQKQSKLDDVIQDIMCTCVGLQDIIQVLSQPSSSMLEAALNRSKEPANKILALLEDTSAYIFNRLTASDPAYASGIEGDVSEIYNVEDFKPRLEKLRISFHLSWSPTFTSCIDAGKDEKPPAFAWKYEQEATDESVTKATDPYEVLNAIRPTHPVGYDPDQACLNGTRKALLNRITTWAQNCDNSDSFLWISGQAGMGKSSIATSLCYYLDGIQALAGSFFCQYNNPPFNDPLGLINGLVYDIANRLPPYAHEVANAIRTNRTLTNGHLRIRYEGLIKGPLKRLKSLSMTPNLTVVIDALDECGDRDSRIRVVQMLHDMSQLVPWLKVIVTARPEVDIVDYFRHHFTHQSIVHLQTYDASDDIRAYIEDQIGNLSWKEQCPNDITSQLTSLAQGLFLWAAVAINYIKKSSILGRSRLQKVIDNENSPVTEHFDVLYTRALRAAMGDDSDEAKVVYQRCIGSILAVSGSDPLSVLDLESLLLATRQIEEGVLEKVVESLGPLVLVKDRQHVIFHHFSFKDYISNPLRSGGFSIQVKQYKADLANCCLTFMQQHLRFNICGLKSSHVQNTEVLDLSTRIHSQIGSVLKYACIYWVDHFIVSPNQALVNIVRRFMEGPQLIYWIEVLSLLGCLNTGLAGLEKLGSLTSAHRRLSGWSSIISRAKDAHRTFSLFYDAIKASTPHLYLSAIAFAPTKSFIAQSIRPYFPNTVSIFGGNNNWHPCVKTIFHSHAVQSLSISRDGIQVATGHSDGSVCIWDMNTGDLIRKAGAKHSTSVTCVMFSPCGRNVASSSYDSNILVCNISENNKPNHVLVGHTCSVHSIAFSAVSSLVASGSADKTIRLWDTESMKPIGQPYVGHANQVSSVVFSPDGTKLASGSWDKTIRIWSIDTNSLKLGPNPLIITGHSDSVTCIAFSPDGSGLTSGSTDGTLQTWNVQNGSNLKVPSSPTRHSESIISITYSPNGNLIASSSLDGSIQLWDAEAVAPISRSFGHSNAINSIAFSPDGKHLVSGSTDMTTRIWNIDACPKLLHTAAPFVGHQSTVYSVAVSSDGTRIISASADHTLRVWNAQTGSQIGEPYVGHTSNVHGVAFSPDEAYVVSSSNDNTMRLWDTATHAVVNTYQHGSIINAPEFSPDGALIAYGSHDHNVYLWEPVEWKLIGEAWKGHSDAVLSIKFSPDGACVASASLDRIIQLWDIKTHDRLGEPFSGHTAGIRSVAFSPCGMRLVSGSEDKTIRVWDRTTGQTIIEMTGHTQPVAAATFSPDGCYIGSGSFDASVRLWNAKTGQIIGQPLVGHAGNVRCITFSPDGNYLVSSSNDSKIRVWDLEALYKSVESQINNLPNMFRWPTNPYELSSHPHHPEWVTRDQRSLAFWLPPHLQKPDQFLNAHPHGSSQTLLDYSKFVDGADWPKVACHSTTNDSGQI
ncbi:putative WD repeat-containing protein alr3466 [Nostoc sp, PCC 7120] [Rhizoctonia solani]|uniref:Putative WD repeat-containing protein alr3466 [Nostoc sp, PCC 7120] n=1 Tax=Rhizoctonia solani TaxID=456999 RepID=A0A0K6G412_9AGAM|nr:putative WD repeat-containing protein alr3466 [Nostoc sp, PCC 7120] [Rhizoctonia solani]